MFDNYPPGISPNQNKPPHDQPVDMYADLSSVTPPSQPNPMMTNNPSTPQFTNGNVPPSYNQPYSGSSGSFKFLIIGLITLVLVLAGAFAAYQIILKPKFENKTPIDTQEALPMDGDGLKFDDTINSDPVATTSTDTEIIYEAPVTTTSTNPDLGGDLNPATSTVPEEIVTQPVEVDSDNDGLIDDLEMLKGTDKNTADTDKDGLTDGDEVLKYETDPLKLDTDSDELSDGDEINKFQSKPLIVDTDGDGFSDGKEVKNGYNPLGSGRLVLPK